MTAETIKKQPLTKTRKPRPCKADRKQIAKLIIDNELTQEQTSALTGISRSRISEIMSEIRTNPETIQFSKNKDKIYEGLQAKLINLADDDALKTMLSKRGFTDVGILEDKIRLIRGESTQNISYDSRSITASISELREMVKMEGKDNEQVEDAQYTGSNLPQIA
jgi:predicted XRE-type DNA-binding protein